MADAMMPPGQQQSGNPNLEKAADAVVQGLAKLYKEIQVAEPDSPLGDAVMNILKATVEVQRNAGMSVPPAAEAAAGGEMPPEEGGMPPGDMESPAEDMAEPPDAEMAEGEAGPPPTDMAGAVSGLHNDMMAAAKRRQGQ